jgi:adenosylcobinamide-GDP ribazoletransferase
MKDPRAGSWAVVGVGLLLIGKYAALQLVGAPVVGAPVVGAPVVVAAAVAGRWAMVVAATAFPYARSGGVGGWFREGFGRREWVFSTASAVIVLATCTLFEPASAVGFLGIAVALGVGRWAAPRLGGGLTGDVYGATCELTELVVLVGAALWLGISL